MSEAGGVEAVVILKTPVNVSSSSSKIVRNPVMHNKAKSWSGGGTYSFSQNGAAATFPKSQQVTKGSYTRSDLPDMQSSYSNGHADPNDSNKALGLVRSSQGTTRSPAVALEHPNANGEIKQHRKGWRSGLRGKEAKLERLFWQVLTSRAAVAEKRRELRAARLAMEQVDEGLMKLIREKRTQQCNSTYENFLELESHYRRLQDARDKYGSLEESYDTMEERLDEDEYKITKLAEELQGDDDESTTHPEQDESEILSRASDDERSGDSRAVEEQEHPLYNEYLSMLGDADLVREDIAELRFEFRKLQEAQLLRHKVHSSLSKNGQAIKDNFFTKEAALLEKLNDIELNVERLENDCKQAGLLNKENEETETSAGKEYNNKNTNKSVWADLNGLTDPKGGDGQFNVVSDQSGEGEVDEKINILEELTTTTADRERYSLLLGQPAEEKIERDIKSLISDFNPQDPGDRIARWILHRLRSSYSEVELLERISVQHGLDPPANMGKWQEDVLEFWFLDSTFMPPSAYQVQHTPTGLDIPSSPFADRENQALFNSGQAHLIQLVIRSSSIFDKLEFALILRLTIPKGEVAKSV